MAALATAGLCATVCAPAGAAITEGDARVFLSQASFGPTEATVKDAAGKGRAAWLQAQFGLPSSDYSGFSYETPNSSVGCPTGAVATCFRDHYTTFPVQLRFFRNALNGPDQLRQRVALALSEILVVSGAQIRQPYAMANYQRIFLANAFGNFRNVLREVTLSPAMGAFLNGVNNDKPNPARGTAPNENYAREVLQLFSVGLWQLNADGTEKRDARGALIPSYSQDMVEGFAHAFTGWTYPPTAGTASRFGNPVNFSGPMVAFADHHDTGAKLLLDGRVLAAGGTPQSDLEAAIDSLFNHPNVGPFIGRQLIQQLVTSNPSPAYVARVTAAFNGGKGTPRGDMKAVISAILLDAEAARAPVPNNAGKLREPVLLLTHLFRSLGGTSDGVWLRNQAQALGEPVFSPPTVFGFFSPDYALPDDPKLDGPPFGLFSASSAMTLSGILSTALSGNPIAADTTVAGATGSKIDLTPWQALAANPTALVAEVNRVLFGGRMSALLQQTLGRAALLQPATKPLARVQNVLFLAAMSPEYLVEN